MRWVAATHAGVRKAAPIAAVLILFAGLSLAYTWALYAWADFRVLVAVCLAGVTIWGVVALVARERRVAEQGARLADELRAREAADLQARREADIAAGEQWIQAMNARVAARARGEDIGDPS
jgi:endonuclease/exonuclease/phosphatase (EEP) superfamily protein YafD